MTPWGKWRRWRARRRWRNAARGASERLREFVYLDEVSVYSLTASQFGEIIEQVSESQTKSMQSEVSSSAGASAVVKTEIGSRLQVGETRGAEVVRKATLQSTFKRLRNGVDELLVLRPAEAGKAPPRVRSVRELSGLGCGGSHRWVVDPASLARGDLVEVDVRLESAPIYRLNAMVSSLLPIIEEDAGTFGMANADEVAQVRVVGRVLDKLLAGLVPLRGVAADYVVATYDNEEWVVHRAVLDAVEHRPSRVSPLHLVGVAEQSLFWKDIRRVLFAGTPYHVLARLGRDGLQSSWSPVKLVDVLRPDFPEIAAMVDAATEGALPLVQAATRTPAEPPPSRVRDVLVAYAMVLAAEAAITVSVDELDAAGLLDVDGDPAMTVTGWREACAPLTDYIAERSGEQVDTALAATARMEAKVVAGLPLIGPPPADTPAIAPAREVGDERLLDSEIVAIYW